MYLYEHTVALCLNNIGVALLNRGCYLDGLATLRDSVSIMNTVCQIANGVVAAHETPFSSILGMVKMLNSANHRLAMSHKDQNKGLPGNHSSPPSVFQEGLVKFDSLDNSFDDDRSSLIAACDFNSAIILFNFALGHRLFAEEEQQFQKTRSKKLMEVALRLLRYSSAILVSLVQETNIVLSSKCPFSLALQVLKNLVEVSFMLNVGANDYMLQMHQVQVKMEQEVVTEKHIKGAAAA